MSEIRFSRSWYVSIIILVGLYVGPLSAAEDPRSLVKALSGEYALIRPPKPDEISYFRITRVDLTLNAEGKITRRTKSDGIFKRMVVYVNDDSTWMDRYTWKSFFIGQVEGTGDSLVQREIEAIRGFSYDLMSSNPYSVPPIQIGGLAKTADTFAFFVVAWDAVLFNHAVTAHASYPFQTVTRIGDRVIETESRAPVPFDFTPIVSNFSYTRRPLSSTFSGLSLVESTPCAVIQFEAPHNPISFDFTSGAMKIHIAGTEWVTGKTYLSLDDHTVYRGEMNSTMVALQIAIMPGQQIRHPITVLQKVTLERITAEEFE